MSERHTAGETQRARSDTFRVGLFRRRLCWKPEDGSVSSAVGAVSGRGGETPSRMPVLFAFVFTAASLSLCCDTFTCPPARIQHRVEQRGVGWGVIKGPHIARPRPEGLSGRAAGGETRMNPQESEETRWSLRQSVS